MRGVVGCGLFVVGFVVRALPAWANAGILRFAQNDTSQQSVADEEGKR
jgi:hypothetical protein